MPNPNQVFVDNSVPFGSRIEKVGTVTAGSPPSVPSGTSYVLESISLTYPTKEIRRPDQIGAPNGFVLVRDQPTGSATIQVPMGSGSYNSSTGGWDGVPWPALGQGFVDNFLANNEVWIISHIGEPFEMQGYYKAPVNLIQAVFAGASGL